jgi:hypothetical protein
MTQEEKKLLLKDLCARLPYGVKFKWCDNFHTDDYYTLIGIKEGLIIGRDVNQDDCFFFWEQDKIKPYLRPMSSMTEEEARDIAILHGNEPVDILSIMVTDEYIKIILNDSVYHTIISTIWYDKIISSLECFDYLNKKMFDFRGLIPKDLAISTEVFNPYNKD